MSNVNVADEVLSAYQEQKLGRGKILYIVLQINGEDVEVCNS